MLRRRKQPLRRIVVYAIVSQLDMRLYVGQCSEASLTAVYRHHINGKYEATAQLFADSVAAQKMPRLYRLTEYEGYTNKSRVQQYAYMKYFTEHGYQVLLQGEAANWIQDISIASQQVYEQLSTVSVENVLSDSACIIKDYQLKEWSRPSEAEETPTKDALVRFSVCTTPENKRRMQELASRCGLSLSEYAEQMMLNGAIVQLDLTPVVSGVNQLYKALYDLNHSIQHYKGVYAGHENELRRIEEQVGALSRETTETVQQAVSKARAEAAKAVRAVARKEART